MKAFIKISLISLITLFTVSSCIVDEGEKIYYKTEPGAFVYGVTTDINISLFLLALDNTLKVDEFLSAVGYDAKIEVEDKYFPYYKIRVIDDTCFIGGPGQFGKIIVDDYSIREVGAEWRSMLFGGISVNITCIAPNKWKLISDYSVYGSIVSECDLEVTVSDINPSLKKGNSIYNYLVSGSGSYSEKLEKTYYYSYDRMRNIVRSTIYKVDYNIAVPVNAILFSGNTTNSPFSYYDGTIEMSLTKDGETVPEPIKAVIGPNPINREVEITYKGITEKWTM